MHVIAGQSAVPEAMEHERVGGLALRRVVEWSKNWLSGIRHGMQAAYYKAESAGKGWIVSVRIDATPFTARMNACPDTILP